MNKEKWEDLLDDLEEESELEFEDSREPEKKDESFYASRLELIERAAKRVKRR